jgi:hypothetical protein
VIWIEQEVRPMTAQSMPARVAALPRDTLLRLVLKLDALVTGVNGVAYLAAAEPLEELLGVSAALMRPVGAFLVLFAAVVWFVATRRVVPRGAALAIAAANAVWALGSLVFAAAGASSPSTVGTVWVVLQALVVGGFAALQALATRPGSAVG